MKIVIMPDSFKSTLSSKELCSLIENKLLTYFDSRELVTLPIADGGEGTIDAFSNSKLFGPSGGGHMVSAKAVDSFFREITAPYLVAGNCALIESAKVCGYSSNPAAGGPMKTTTYGLGLLISHAVSCGCKKIFLGLGGSSTNDGGCGMIAALGGKFFDSEGSEFIPTGESLHRIDRMDLSLNLPEDVTFIGLRDVTNPLFGADGAAFTFAPQKGATPSQVEILNEGLAHLASFFPEEFSTAPGSGAAGGLGFAVSAILKGNLVSGIDTFLDYLDFDTLIEDADYIITGEGRFDSQSLNGKAVSGICRRASSRGVPVILLAGVIEDREIFPEMGIVAGFESGAIDFGPLSQSQGYSLAKLQFMETLGDLLRFFKN